MINSYVLVARRLERPLGSAAFLLAVESLVGYALHYEPLYRPVAGTPAVNPLTLVSILLLSSTHLVNARRFAAIRLVLIGLVGLVAGLRLIDLWLGTDLTLPITPFGGEVAADLQRGGSNAMSSNSAALVLLCSLSGLAREFKQVKIAQFLGFAALSLPVVSSVGYAYAIRAFHGRMSPLTTIMGLILCLAVLAGTAHRNGLRAILLQSASGGIVRLQLLLGAVFPFVVGYLLVRVVSAEPDMETGIFVIAMTWFVVTLIAMSALALERTDRRRRLMERQLIQAATTDALTGLSNRRQFFDACRLEWMRNQRSHGVMALLMLDIDHFKNINDSFGHAVGDEVLRKVGQAIRVCVRATDMAGRIGGEEFAIVLPNTTLQGAGILAEQLRQTIAGLRFDQEQAAPGGVTVSIGCASSTGKTSFENQLACADAALYKAKDRGRNRVVRENFGRPPATKPPHPSGKPQMH